MSSPSGAPVVCGHDGPASVVPVCAHLRADTTPEVPAYAWYTGVGVGMELLCDTCTQSREEGGSVTVEPTCVECFHEITSEVVSHAGVRGSPEVRKPWSP